MTSSYSFSPFPLKLCFARQLRCILICALFQSVSCLYIVDLNEELVQMLMERDELHMEQDSMLVDVEDLTR